MNLQKRLFLTVIIIFILELLVLTSLVFRSDPVDAVSPPPDGYTGTVTYEDTGNPVPDGTTIKVCVDGVFYDNGGGSISNGDYSLLINGDDLDTSNYKEGALGFEELIFWVGDNIAVESGFFSSGGGYEVKDLTIWPAYSPALLVLNEIMVNPSSGTEWIELYNPSTAEVNLEPYSLSDNDGWLFDFTSSDTIPAQGYYVYSIPAMPPIKRFDDSPGDEIKLEWTCPYSWIAGGNTVTIDRVEYGTPSGTSSHGPSDTLLSNAPLPGEDNSLVRTPDGHRSSPIWDPANDFITTATPTPGESIPEIHSVLMLIFCLFCLEIYIWLVKWKKPEKVEF